MAHHEQMVELYRLKVTANRSFGCDFPTNVKKTTIFEVDDQLNVIFIIYKLNEQFLVLRRVVNAIGSSFRSVNVRNKKRTRRRWMTR